MLRIVGSFTMFFINIFVPSLFLSTLTMVDSGRIGLKFNPTLGQATYENEMASVVPRRDLDYSAGAYSIKLFISSEVAIPT